MKARDLLAVAAVAGLVVVLGRVVDDVTRRLDRVDGAVAELAGGAEATTEAIEGIALVLAEAAAEQRPRALTKN